MRFRVLVACLFFVAALPLAEASISGNPGADGWTAHGNSLSNGVYVRGLANYAFDTYSTTLTVDSTLAAAAGNWAVGDTVIGVGGVFNSITAAQAGWAGFTGTGVNSLLSSAPAGPKIQVKFGTSPAWTTSTVAPGAGNGVGSGSQGGSNTIQIRSSGYNDATFWANNAGTLLNLQSSSHISTENKPVGGQSATADVARLIWNVDGNNQLSSWEILLNVTKLGATLDPVPAPGGWAIMTVQDRDSIYTDALVQVTAANGVVPEPATFAVWSILALTVGGASWWQQKRAAH